MTKNDETKTGNNAPKTPNNGTNETGAKGGKGAPETGDHGPAWSGGGKKGEDE